MNAEIARFAGPGIVYLFILGLLWRCVFGSLLDDLHEKLAASRLDSFLLPGMLKDRDFYVRFYKGLCIVVFLLVSALFLLMAMAALAR